LGLDPDGDSSADVKVLIASRKDGRALDLTFEVKKGEETLGTLKARLPAYGRPRTSWIPSLLRFALESNPLSLYLAPDPIWVDEKFLADFLRSVLGDRSNTAAPVSLELPAELESDEQLDPPFVLSNEEEARRHWVDLLEDPRCEGVVVVTRVPHVGKEYVSFSSVPGAQPSVEKTSVWPVICAGDAIYVMKSAARNGGPLLSRYDRAGRYTADISFVFPTGTQIRDFRIEQGSIAEAAGALTFVARAMDGRSFFVPGGTSREWTVKREVHVRVPLPASLTAADN
jgi:hypothetical protein